MMMRSLRVYPGESKTFLGVNSKLKRVESKNSTLKILTALSVIFLIEILVDPSSTATYRFHYNTLSDTSISTPSRNNINKKIIGTVIKSSERTNLDPYLILCIIEIESSYRIHAISGKGAVGLMQIKPSVANSIANQILKDEKYDLHNPEHNITIGTFYLSRLIEYFGDLEKALLAYNIGPTRVMEILKSNEKPPDRYLKKIKGCYSKFTYTQ